MNIETILADTRTIQNIYFADDIHSYRVGQGGITKIVAYAEPALMCDIPWFAVYVGEDLLYRANAYSISTVEYAKENK